MTAAKTITISDARKIESMTQAGKNDIEIAAALGRSISSVQNIRKDIGFSSKGQALPARAAKDLWNLVPTLEIAAGAGVSREMIMRLASLLGLGPNLADGDKPPAAPPTKTVRTYTKAEIDWARKNIRDPQARLIAGLVTGIPVRAFENARVRTRMAALVCP